MDIKELERVKKLISQAELKAAKAEGQLEKIKADWKSQFGTDTVKGAQAELKRLSEKIQEQETRRDELLEKVESITDWDALEDELE
jgi:ubiquitin